MVPSTQPYSSATLFDTDMAAILLGYEIAMLFC